MEGGRIPLVVVACNTIATEIHDFNPSGLRLLGVHEMGEGQSRG